ncbi:hypothetical protein CAK95_11830 [Pseudorhodoplanes sinuspersici]|uniref:Uncharacterized protein n=1 Tax=Pseudorhodoplanes sinuspersici TaxID=1235591 RepID=A0A1W6ZQU1_9HYPH|nr:hypothetical protein CAK95_11830 [Pseudorhodoplanes sinuspersici]
MVGVVGVSIRDVTDHRFIIRHVFMWRLSMLRHQSMLRLVAAGSMAAGGFVDLGVRGWRSKMAVGPYRQIPTGRT